MKELNLFIEKYGYFGFVRFALYPITLLVTSPFIAVISLFNSFKLFLGKWQDYPNYDAKSMFNSYFYHIRAWNIQKFGRTGKSPYLGLGGYHLARCFNYSMFSLVGYWKGGAFSILISMLVWLFSFSLFGQTPLHWIVIAIAFCSTLFHANLYRFQNYNAVGWAFFPIGLYGVVTGDVYFAAAGWLGASFGSFTAVVLGSMLSFIYGVYEMNFIMAFAGVPAVLKLITHFYPFLTNSEAKGILKKVVTAIGAGGKPKYKRKVTKSFDMRKAYYLVLYIQFAIAVYVFTDILPVLFIASIGIYLLNALKVRFADDQSMHMLILSVAVVTMMQIVGHLGGDLLEGSYLTLFTLLIGVPVLLIVFLPFWLVISPLPVLAGWDHRNDVMDKLPIGKPFPVKDMLQENERFLSKVNGGKKVLFAYPDPNDSYEKLWDGYAHIKEMPYYVGMKKDIFMFPDWWAVFELNYEGADDFWGTTPEEVKINLSKWECDYVVVYENYDTPFDKSQWEQDFHIIDELDWRQFNELFAPYKKLRINDLKWYLMELKA